VNKGYSLLVVKVGMGINVCFITVGGPSGVADSNEVIMLWGSLNGHSFYAVSPNSI
jgi:hypothetical protein